MIHLRPDVVEGGPHGRHALVRVTLEMLDATAHDRQRRSQLVARVGGKLALSAQRLADGNEGAAGVEGAARDGERKCPQAADQEDHEERLEGPDVRRPVADDLDHVRLATDAHRRAEDPDGRPGDVGGAHVHGPPLGGSHARLDREPDAGEGGVVGEARPHHRAAGRHDHAERPRRLAAEGEAHRTLALVGRPRTRYEATSQGVEDPHRPLLEGVGPPRVERPRGRAVRRDAQDEQDHQGDTAAPSHQAPADRPQQPGVPVGGGRRRRLADHALREAESHGSAIR